MEELVANGGRATVHARADYFIGAVLMGPIVKTYTCAVCALTGPPSNPVLAPPGQTYPFGQVLHILSGVGRVRCHGGSVLTVQSGDTILIKLNERHWHGASALQVGDDKGR